MTKIQQISAAVLVLVGAIVVAVNGIGIVHWSDVQTGLVLVEAEAGAAFILAVLAHVQHGTKTQPVAVGGTVTVLAAATCALASGFAWWSLTDAQNGLVVGVVTAVVGVFAVIFAHANVNAPTSPPLNG